MPLSELDANAALIVIDLQKGIVANETRPYPASQIIERANALGRAFRKAGYIVVWVHVNERPPGRTESMMNVTFPPDFADFSPDLDRMEGDYTVTKGQIGAFYSTSLERTLQRAGITQVFIVGISTSMGVEMTARDAFDRGYNVVVVTDATSDRDENVYKHSIEVIVPRIAQTTTTDALLTMLKSAPLPKVAVGDKDVENRP